MEAQMTQSCQSNPGRKEQDWRYNPSRLQTILQNYTNQKKKKKGGSIKGRKIGEPHLQESEESQIKEENLDFISSQ